MAGIKPMPMAVKHFEPVRVNSVFGKACVDARGSGSRGGYVQISGDMGCFSTTNARKLAEAIHDAADHLDGGVQAMPSDAKCRCGSKKDLKMVQERCGHWWARLRWGVPRPLCAKCRQKERGIFRYCPTKWGGRHGEA